LSVARGDPNCAWRKIGSAITQPIHAFIPLESAEDMLALDGLLSFAVLAEVLII
jgi:hypothetical protein